jgi:HSP20 family protein
MTDKRKSQPTKDAKPDSNALALPSRSPLGMFDEFFRPFDQFMEPFFQGDIRSLFPGLASARQPNLDLQDRGDHFSLTAELPGFSKEDVEVKAGPDGIELKAKRSKSETKGKDGEGSYRSTSSSYFHQYLGLPEQVDVDKIGGTMKNGILELRIPKAAPGREDKARRVDLK